MSRQPIASLTEIRRELPPDWQAPLPENPTAREIADAWAEDAAAVFEAACRTEERRRAELIAYHRAQLHKLGAA